MTRRTLRRDNEGVNTWPFPPFPNPQDKPGKGPKFNPNNHEDAPL